MISPKSRQSSSGWSVVKPSSRRRAMRRSTRSVPAGDSIGVSAFSSCILFDQAEQIGEFKRFAEVVVGAAGAGLLGDVAVAGEDHVRDPARLLELFEVAAKGLAVHPFDGEVGETLCSNLKQFEE